MNNTIPYKITAISPDGKEYVKTIYAESLKEAMNRMKTYIAEEDPSILNYDIDLEAS